MSDEDQSPRPMITRAARASRQFTPQPPPQKASPIGAMIGCLIAGTWCLLFGSLFNLNGGFFWVVGGLGFTLTTLGLILAGIVAGEALEKRHHG